MGILQMVNPYRVPTTTELVARQLAEAERGLLDAESGQEHYNSEVVKYRARVKRLRQHLRDITEESKEQSNGRTLQDS